MKLVRRKEKVSKILLASGHAATTVLATIEQLYERKDKNFEIHWAGSKYAFPGKNIPTLEFEIATEWDFTFHPMIAGKIVRQISVWGLIALLLVPIGFIHALILLIRVRPDVIVSFGGNSAFPVSIVGAILRFPVIVHEQTSAAGRANIISAKFATKILLARASSKSYFPSVKSEIIGNPVMRKVLSVVPKKVIGRPPTIYITGGSRGSVKINRVVERVLPSLIKDYKVIHQTGRLEYQHFLKVKSKLGAHLKDSYIVFPTIKPSIIAGIYKRADIIIGRAGANTVSDIIAVKRPSILIPIPWTNLNEQEKNALFAEKYGIARVINEKVLTGRRLLAEIKTVEENWEKMLNVVSSRKSPDIRAAGKLVDNICKYL